MDSFLFRGPGSGSSRSKRQRHQQGFWDNFAVSDEEAQQESAEADDLDDDLWTDRALFAIDIPQHIATVDPNANLDWAGDWNLSSNALKRNASQTLWDASVGDADQRQFGQWDLAQQALFDQIPQLFPSVPAIEDREVDLGLVNPFSSNGLVRFEKLRDVKMLSEDGGVNGYIKFRLRMADVEPDAPTRQSVFFQKDQLGKKAQQSSQQAAALPHEQHISNLPPNFGRGLKLDAVDTKLMKFFTVAYCQGRTLLNKTNFWLYDVVPMASTYPSVKHALLAVAGSYLLDYLPSPELLSRINRHYRKANEALDAALRDPETHAVAKGDSIISAILLLIIDDGIHWDMRKPKEQKPNWYVGAHLAKKLLDQSDPGYRYWKTQNVQFDKARLANANWAAFACILAEPVTPLSPEKDERLYGWLLEGTEAEVRKIHGSTGLCPKLLHMMAQVTYLSARLKETPDSTVIPVGGISLRKKLVNFHQHSELSKGYKTVEELFRSCQLVNGKVTTAAKVTELTGESWVAAIQIYLECRFFRKPRTHPDVQDHLNRLLECIVRMPYTGELFTAQMPFFPIVLASLVSVHERERSLTREWFELICAGASARSSVPPVWKVVQSTWRWLDGTFVEPDFDEATPIGQRSPWWEELVAYLIENEGYVELT